MAVGQEENASETLQESEQGSSWTSSLYSCNNSLLHLRKSTQSDIDLFSPVSPSLPLCLWKGVKVARGWDTKQCLGTADNGQTWTWEREGNECHNAWKPPTGNFKIKWANTISGVHTFVHTHTQNEQWQETCHSSKTYTNRSTYIKENCSTHVLKLKPFLK